MGLILDTNFIIVDEREAKCGITTTIDRFLCHKSERELLHHLHRGWQASLRPIREPKTRLGAPVSPLPDSSVDQRWLLAVWRDLSGARSQRTTDRNQRHVDRRHRAGAWHGSGHEQCGRVQSRARFDGGVLLKVVATLAAILGELRPKPKPLASATSRSETSSPLPADALAIRVSQMPANHSS